MVLRIFCQVVGGSETSVGVGLPPLQFPAARHLIIKAGGYRIVAIITGFQPVEGGSIPPTRSGLTNSRKSANIQEATVIAQI